MNQICRDRIFTGSSTKAGKLDNDGYIPLSNINFKIANLKNAYLANSRLDEAALQNALLDKADLYAASLCGARMSGARLYRTMLSKADLTNTILRFTFLKEADLSHATLHGTDLSSTNLTGAELGSSHPWKAKLYRDSDSMSSSYQDVKCDKQINCVADLIEQCNKLDVNRSDAVIYFRGEHTSEWELRPSVMRCSGLGDLPLRSKESQYAS